MLSDRFLYKREINKSVLYDGFGIDREYLDIFLSRIGKLKRGEKRNIQLVLNGKTYQATINNLNNPEDKRVNDAYQIRYPGNGEFARALQSIFYKSYNYILSERKLAEGNSGQRSFIKIPEEYKEYLAIYTTEIASVFVCEPIVSDEILELKRIAENQSERVFESEFNYDVHDDTAGLNTKTAVVRVRKLNKKIGDSLKEHYGYRCQICGRMIGEPYDSHLVEAHHIDYFVKSLNNDLTNILIVCPNHHGIIHDKDPIFDYKKCTYEYPNGYKEGLVLNDHLGKQ